ncbi:hypothetical protein ACWD60_41930, partial [Streptomyces sp. NPDC005167]
MRQTCDPGAEDGFQAAAERQHGGDFAGRAAHHGRIGASCLSQWWPSPFTVDGVAYASAEH